MDLTGSFIIAMPNLLDPNFHRSVVLLMEHTEEGSLGLVINRPGPIEVGELCESLSLEWQGEAEECLFVGGPVQPGRIWMLHGRGDEVPESFALIDGCSFSTTWSALQALAQHEEPRCRILGGYAGWGPGQLETELRQGAWLTRDADCSLIFHHTPADVWELSLRGVGIDPFALVPGGGEIQ